MRIPVGIDGVKHHQTGKKQNPADQKLNPAGNRGKVNGITPRISA